MFRDMYTNFFRLVIPFYVNFRAKVLLHISLANLSIDLVDLFCTRTETDYHVHSLPGGFGGAEKGQIEQE